jgi:hypothetical protein
MTPANFLAAEPLLIARLRAVLPPEVHVLAAADLNHIVAAHQPTPAVHVLYLGYRVADARVGAAVGLEPHRITVVVARNVADIEQGFHARQDAGPLAARVLDALYHHRLRDARGRPLGINPLRPADAPVPGFMDGHFYLPLGWAVAVNFTSNECPA